MFASAHQSTILWGRERSKRSGAYSSSPRCYVVAVSPSLPFRRESHVPVIDIAPSSSSFPALPPQYPSDTDGSHSVHGGDPCVANKTTCWGCHIFVESWKALRTPISLSSSPFASSYSTSPLWGGAVVFPRTRLLRRRGHFFSPSALSSVSFLQENGILFRRPPKRSSSATLDDHTGALLIVASKGWAGDRDLI